LPCAPRTKNRLAFCSPAASVFFAVRLITPVPGQALTADFHNAADWLPGSFPEAPVTDPSLIMGSGYGESKWVSERILLSAAAETPLKPVVVRVGQLVGGLNGAWNVHEWFPSLVGGSQALGCVPNNEGVSSSPFDHHNTRGAEKFFLFFCSRCPGFRFTWPHQHSLISETRPRPLCTWSIRDLCPGQSFQSRSHMSLICLSFPTPPGSPSCKRRPPQRRKKIHAATLPCGSSISMRRATHQDLT